MKPEAIEPLIDGADRVVVFYDRTFGKATRTPGAWIVRIKRGELVHTFVHRCQRDAYEAVGLEGGAVDPEHRPPAGQTGARVVVG